METKDNTTPDEHPLLGWTDELEVRVRDGKEDQLHFLQRSGSRATSRMHLRDNFPGLPDIHAGAKLWIQAKGVYGRNPLDLVSLEHGEVRDLGMVPLTKAELQDVVEQGGWKISEEGLSEEVCK